MQRFFHCIRTSGADSGKLRVEPGIGGIFPAAFALNAVGSFDFDRDFRR
jgi:hypothetical protein